MIRRAEKKDISKIMDLLVQVNMVHHNARPDLFKGPTTKYSEEELALILANDETPVFVYEDSGVVKAHLFCEMKTVKNDRLLEDIKTMYIDDLCVDENCRGEHIASMMYDYAAVYAREAGCYNITLNVWEGNDDAIAFYKSRGMSVQKYGMETIL